MKSGKEQRKIAIIASVFFFFFIACLHRQRERERQTRIENGMTAAEAAENDSCTVRAAGTTRASSGKLPSNFNSLHHPNMHSLRQQQQQQQQEQSQDRTDSLVDAMSSGHDPFSIDKSSATGDLLIEVLSLDDSRLPRYFTKFHILSTNDLGLARVHTTALCV